MELPLYDDHLHLSPSGRGIDALREFRAAGGTGMTLVTLPYPEVRISCGDDFRRSFSITASFARQARELGLLVHPAVGPYPVLMVGLAEQLETSRVLGGIGVVIEQVVVSGRLPVCVERAREEQQRALRVFVDKALRILAHGKGELGVRLLGKGAHLLISLPGAALDQVIAYAHERLAPLGGMPVAAPLGTAGSSSAAVLATHAPKTPLPARSTPSCSSTTPSLRATTSSSSE